MGPLAPAFGRPPGLRVIGEERDAGGLGLRVEVIDEPALTVTDEVVVLKTTKAESRTRCAR